MRERGVTVREIARMAGIGEKTARELMRLVNGTPAAAAGADGGGGNATAVNGAADAGPLTGAAAATVDVQTPAADPLS
jgi:hypothetical protein